MHVTRLELVNCDQHTSSAVAKNVRTWNLSRGRSCCVRRPATGTRWVQGALPLCALILVPKCPACLAILVAAGTGLSLSFQTAAQMRGVIIAVCLLASVMVWIRSR